MRDAVGAVQSILVLGGRSEIGLATVRALATPETRVVLAVRNPDADRDAAPLREAGLDFVDVVAFDAEATDGHARFVEEVVAGHGDFDVVLLAFGVLGDQEQGERDGAAASEVIRANFLGAATVMVPLIAALRAQGHGALVVLSSVAAERPRRSNFVYGSSKAGLDAFAHGFSDALVDTGVSLLVVRPGFVHTAMTAGLKPPPLSTTPEAVAEAVAEGLRSGRRTVWVPSPLRWVMSVLRHLPASLFRRLDL